MSAVLIWKIEKGAKKIILNLTIVTTVKNFMYFLPGLC